MGEEKERTLPKEKVQNSQVTPTSWRDVEISSKLGWCYIKWFDGYRLCKVLGYSKGNLVVETANKGTIEINNLKAIQLAEPTQEKYHDYKFI